MSVPAAVVEFRTEQSIAWRWCDSCRVVIEHRPAPECPVCATPWPKFQSNGVVTITAIDRDTGTLTASSVEE